MTVTQSTSGQLPSNTRTRADDVILLGGPSSPQTAPFPANTNRLIFRMHSNSVTNSQPRSEYLNCADCNQSPSITQRACRGGRRAGRVVFFLGGGG